MLTPSVRHALLSAAMLVLSLANLWSQDDQAAKDTLIVETVLRLENFDFSKAPEKVSAAVSRHLKANPGTDEFFQLIERHGLNEYGELLLDVAVEDTRGKGARAARLLLNTGAGDAILKRAATSDGASLDRLLKGVGLSGTPKGVALLTTVLTGDGKLPTRLAATRALASSKAGEAALLNLAANGALPADVTLTAANALQNSLDREIRSEAAKHLKMPATADSRPLPALAELTKRTGDPAKGKEVYQRICFICHKVGDEGIDFGPALTEIGDKLAKEALYTAILDPGAAISFGFEGYEIGLKDGTGLVGYIASQTDDELTLRVPGGANSSFKKSQIVKQQKLNISLMPPNLQAGVTEQGLVDLVEFLATLRK
jgi:putative heme-binding domain-containing protein